MVRYVEGYLTVADLVAESGLDRSAVRRRIYARNIPTVRGPGPGGGALLIRSEYLPDVLAEPQKRPPTTRSRS